MAIKTDSFTEASDTPLENHGGWSGWDTTNLDIVAADDEVKDDGADTNQRWALGDENPSSADQWCEIVGKTGLDSGTGWIGALVRGVASSSDAYYAYVTYGGSAGNGTLTLRKIVSGVITELGSYGFSGFSNSTYYTVRVEAEGTTIRALLDGTERISVTDSDLSAAGNIGLTIRRTFTRITSLDSDVIGGGVTVTPAPATLVTGGVDPTVMLGAVSVTPSPATLRADGVAPAVILGGISLTPSPAMLRTSGVDPVVVLGGLNITPLAAALVTSGVNPLVVLGAIALTPSPANLFTSGVNPAVVLGSVVIIPSPAVVYLSALIGAILAGSGIQIYNVVSTDVYFTKTLATAAAFTQTLAKSPYFTVKKGKEVLF